MAIVCIILVNRKITSKEQLVREEAFKNINVGLRIGVSWGQKQFCWRPKMFSNPVTAIEHFHMDILPGFFSNWPYPLVQQSNLTNDMILLHKIFTNREFIHFSFTHKWSKLTTETSTVKSQEVIWGFEHRNILHIFTNLYIPWKTDWKSCRPYTRANNLIIQFCYLWTTNSLKFHGLHILLMWKTKTIWIC